MSSGVDSSGSFIGPTENPGGSLFIDGSFAAAEGVVIAGNNPADGSEGFSYPAATAEEVGRAVASSRRALNGIWLETSPGLRKKQLCDFASAIVANASGLAAYDSLDTGKPISMALGEARRGAMPGQTSVLVNTQAKTLPAAHSAKWLQVLASNASVQ